jgi:hypothetical protein
MFGSSGKRATRSSANAVVTPESLLQEETGVADELQRLGLVVKDVKGDGGWRLSPFGQFADDRDRQLSLQVCDMCH